MLASAGLHVAEETLLNFVGFVESVGIRCTWHEFDFINFAYIIAGIAAAAIGWRAPSVSLSYPALLLWNVIFHTGASVVWHHANPGVFTAIVLFLPVGTYCFLLAARDGVLTRRRTVLAFTLGLILQVYPLLLAILRDHFRY